MQSAFFFKVHAFVSFWPYKPVCQWILFYAIQDVQFCLVCLLSHQHITNWFPLSFKKSPSLFHTYLLYSHSLQVSKKKKKKKNRLAPPLLGLHPVASRSSSLATEFIHGENALSGHTYLSSSNLMNFFIYLCALVLSSIIYSVPLLYLFFHQGYFFFSFQETPFSWFSYFLTIYSLISFVFSVL